MLAPPNCRTFPCLWLTEQRVDLLLFARVLRAQRHLVWEGASKPDVTELEAGEGGVRRLQWQLPHAHKDQVALCAVVHAPDGMPPGWEIRWPQPGGQEHKSGLRHSVVAPAAPSGTEAAAITAVMAEMWWIEIPDRESCTGRIGLSIGRKPRPKVPPRLVRDLLGTSCFTVSLLACGKFTPEGRGRQVATRMTPYACNACAGRFGGDGRRKAAFPAEKG